MTTSLNEFERKVCLAQIDHITKAGEQGDRWDTYDEMYPFVQKYANIAVGKRPLFKSVVLPNPSKKISKADKIKWENTIRIIGEFFSPKRNIFQNAEVLLLLQSPILDMKVVGFCFIFYTYIASQEFEDNRFIFSAIISAQRFINYLKIHYPEARMTADISYYCAKAITISKYNGAALQEQAPELITLSPFDAFIPTVPIEPYPAQKELYQLFSNADFTQNGGIVFLSTATNSGKTFSVVGLSKRIDMLRKYISMRLLFSCVVESVRDKVEELLRFANIPYAVIRETKCTVSGCQHYYTCKAHEQSNLYTVYDPTVKEEMMNTQTNRKILELEGFTIVKKGSKTSGWRTAILDPETNIITKNPSGSHISRDFSVILAPPHLCISYLSGGDDIRAKTALFLDEFTIGATDLSSSVLENHMRLIHVAPKWTFLSNANFIGDHRMAPIISNHNSSFKDSKMYNIASSTVYTCSSIKTHCNLDVLPHYNCGNKREFTLKLKNIMKNQFKGRMYNVSALKTMHALAKKCIVYSFSYEEGDDKDSIAKFTQRLPDIDTLFNDVSNLYPDNIRKLSIEILQVIESIEEDGDDEKDTDEETGEENEEDNEEDNNTAQTLFSKGPKYNSMNNTQGPYEYSGGMNLIGAITPEAYAREHFSVLLSKIKARLSLSKLSADYEKASDVWDSQYAKMATIKYKDEQDRLIALSDIEDTRPTLQFPEDLQIGLALGRVPIQIGNIDFMRMKNEDMVLLLFAGVGIYDENEQDKLYLQTLFTLGMRGQLAYIISNVSYGMDYPFARVYISKEFSDKKSMNEVYQLLSRGGRGQMSNLAKIFISDACANKILDVDEEGDAVEVMNMLIKF